MGKYTMIDPGLFPVGLREVVTMPIHSSTEDYRPHFDKLSTQELEMALKILMQEYPGYQMERKSRIRAEINRRERHLKKVGFEKAILPRLHHWNEDFPRIWNETCEPIRRAINESRNKSTRNRATRNHDSRRY